MTTPPVNPLPRLRPPSLVPLREKGGWLEEPGAIEEEDDEGFLIL